MSHLNVNNEVIDIATIYTLEKQLGLECGLEKRGVDYGLDIVLCHEKRRLMLAVGLPLKKEETIQWLNLMEEGKPFVFNDSQDKFQMRFEPSGAQAHTEWWFDARAGAPIGYGLWIEPTALQLFAVELRNEALSPKLRDTQSSVAVVNSQLRTCVQHYPA